MAGIFVYMENRITIQGYEGSFHEEAARLFFGKSVQVICCDTFSEVVRIAGIKRACEGAVMAIENSIAGSILPNYQLLQKSNLTIVGEVYLPIKQQLMVNPGVRMEDIQEVHSHPMALQQCLGFLEKHPWKLVEKEDTALSAKHIRQHHSKRIAAIASKLAAEIYQLEILVPNIHTLTHNYTRFLVLRRAESVQYLAGANNASIHFHTDHSRGSLAKVLTKIAAAGINLSKLQSFPIPGSDFLYAFHADLEFDLQEQFDEMLKQIRPVTSSLRIFGIYKNGKIKK